MRRAVFSSFNLFHSFFKIRYKERLRVLAYHKVPDAQKFEKQIQYLRDHYSIISVEQLLNSVKGDGVLPENPLLITFDDGDISVYEKGLPLLKKYHLDSCLFIITGLINTDEDVWIKRIEQKEMAEGKTYLEARQVVRHLKQISNSERKKVLRDYPAVKKQQLTSQQLCEMRENHMFIANHTHTHPMLDKCTSEEVQEELDLAREVFRDLNIEGFEVFAYPNGNQDANTKKVLEQNKLELIFLFDHKINKKKLDPMYISRIKVDTDTEIEEFKAKVSGAHPFLFNLRNRTRTTKSSEYV